MVYDGAAQLAHRALERRVRLLPGVGALTKPQLGLKAERLIGCFGQLLLPVPERIGGQSVLRPQARTSFSNPNN